MALPKVILQLYPMFPADGEAGRKAQRPLGNNREIYNNIVHEWDEIIREADKMGVWGASTIEHHLHSEGYEVGPNPGVLNARWSSMVENMHIGALGYVAATQDPIRVAEETAIIDHMCNGKYFVGFSPGLSGPLDQYSGPVFRRRGDGLRQERGRSRQLKSLRGARRADHRCMDAGIDRVRRRFL